MTFEFTALLWELLIAVHVEICLFVMAALAYLALFGNVMPRNHKLANSRRVKPFEDVAPSAKRTAHAPHAVDRRVKQAAGSSDYNNVMKQWSFMKKSATLPSTSLAEIVEAMQYSKREPAFIFRELKDFMTNHASELDMGYINDFLDALAKRYDSDLMEQIADFLPSIGLEPNVRTHEISLAMYFSARDFQAVGSYAARMKTNRARFSMRAITITIKAALKPTLAWHSNVTPVQRGHTIHVEARHKPTQTATSWTSGRAKALSWSSHSMTSLAPRRAANISPRVAQRRDWP